jgi:hypothetical protein
MFTPKQFRAKAAEYVDLVRTSTGPNEKREFQELEKRFNVLADNEQWLMDNHNKIIHAPEQDRSNGVTLAEEEEHVLRCLGAALLMQWNTLPAKLRRQLFDNAGSMGELLKTSALRGQIARFLHKHENGEEPAT